MEDDTHSQKSLCVYQSAWSMSVIVTVILALTLPFANIVIWRINVGPLTQEIDLDVDVLKCFTPACQQKQDEAIAHELYYSPRSGSTETSISHPSFVGQTQLGSLGTILFFLFTGLIFTIQAPSILMCVCSSKLIPQHSNYSCCIRTNPETSLRLMVFGSLSLLVGLLWYPVVMMSVLNGGSFRYGYWITQMSALCSLAVAVSAYKDKNIWDSFYQVIPDLPDKNNRSSQLDELLDYEPKLSYLDVYQTAPSLSSISFDEGEGQIAA